MLILKIILLIASSVISFIFSGIEAGVSSINRSRIKKQMREGDKGASLLLNFQRDPKNFYFTVLLGNTIANGVFAVVLVLLLHEISSGAPFGPFMLPF